MNLFDEHLFDEEMKLFKFPTDKEKKEKEPSQATNSTQEMISPNESILDKDTNLDVTFNMETNNNDDKKQDLNKPQNQNIEKQKNINKLQFQAKNQNYFQQNPQQQFTQQQTLISPPFFQSNVNFPGPKQDQFIKKIGDTNFHNQLLPNAPFVQQPILPNPNLFPINTYNNISSSTNTLIKDKNKEKVVEKHRKRRKVSPGSGKSNLNLKTDTNINFNIPPPNIDLTNNMNNITPINNAFFRPTIPTDIDRFNLPLNNDLNLSKCLSCSNTDEDALFNEAMENSNMRFNPVKLGFIPSAFWADNDMTFSEIVKSFFQRKNNSKCRFPHKLYNALIFTQTDPSLFPIIGAYWVDRTSILIKRKSFARLLGIKSIEGSLFHQQGNFPSHGFIEIDPKIVKMRFPNFDFTVNRLITHKTGAFVYGCTEADIDGCKWNSFGR